MKQGVQATWNSKDLTGVVKECQETGQLARETERLMRE